jgi:hypothetical protein
MIERRNHEGYADPTAYVALTKVFRQNQFTYICSPYRDNPRVNVMRARQYCKFAVGRGRIPLAPHLYFPQFLSEIDERGKAMSMNFELMRLCGEVWVFGERVTEGMETEIAHAGRLRKNVHYFTTKCEEVLAP